MKISAFFVLIIIINSSCQQNKKEEKKQTHTSTTQIAEIDSSQLAKKWLVGSVENYFKQWGSDTSFIESICTKRYIECKIEGINIEYSEEDPEIAYKKYQKRWRNIYDLDLIDTSSGFFISGQDFGDSIKVNKCELIKQLGPNSYLFETEIEDAQFKTKHHRDFIVITQNHKFLIDFVHEYEKQESNKTNAN